MTVIRQIHFKIMQELCNPNSTWVCGNDLLHCSLHSACEEYFLNFFFKGISLEKLVLVFGHSEVLHLLGSLFRHHLGCFLWAGSWAGHWTGIWSVCRTVGILPVAEYDATHSHVGGAHLDLKHMGECTCKHRKIQLTQTARVCI